MTDADPVRGDTIVDLARSMGFPLVGITPATPIDRDDESRLRDWLAKGQHAEMHYLADNIEARIDPRRAMPGAKSMILVAEQYWRRNPNDHFPKDPPPDAFLSNATGRIAKYARGDDYHKAIKKRLFALNDALLGRYRDRLTTPDDPTGRAALKAVVDTAPVMERQHAARAGLGWTGKHSLIIHQRRGSYLFLGAILTTLNITPPKNQRPTPDRCGTCTRCIDACPTHAITPYAVDASKCISYLTIEHRSPIDPAFHNAMGEWIFGCDICQDVCPHNSPRPDKPAHVNARPEYAPRDAPNPAAPKRATLDGASGGGVDLLDLLGWSEDDRRAALERSAIKRASLAMLKRNALIAAANALRLNDQPALRTRIAQIADAETEDPLVIATAKQVVKALKLP